MRDERARKKQTGRIITGFVVLALIAAVAIAGFITQRPNKSEAVTVTISAGSSTGDIASALAENDVIDNEFLFKLYIKRNGDEDALQAGDYGMRTGMTYADALAVLMKGPKTRYYSILITEGLTVEETAARVEKSSPITAEEFIEAAQNGSYDYDFLNDDRTDLEGYLFPKTYTITDKTQVGSLINLMLKQYERETAALDFKSMAAKGFTERDIIIIASIIEKEVKLPDERAKVAAVIYNRLADGMYLQMCATVQYALPERKAELSYTDLEYPSPYNTYLNPGLPPGPIASPGLASIEAALDPAEVDYLYYVLTGSDGSHTFTSSDEEFNRIKSELGI